jgi:hypothetical protein
MNSVLASTRFGGRGLLVFNRGPAPQLGARFHGMDEVVGRLSVATPLRPIRSAFGYAGLRFGSGY